MHTKGDDFLMACVVSGACEVGLGQGFSYSQKFLDVLQEPVKVHTF